MRRFVASGFGLGWLPRRLRGSDGGAGTVGAVGGAMLARLLWPAPLWVHVAVTVVFVGLSVWSAQPYSDDPGWVVIDEQAGVLIALSGLSGVPWLVAFVVFRITDIFKGTPGVGPAERLPAGWGITADDVLAGVYGLAAGLLTSALIG